MRRWRRRVVLVAVAVLLAAGSPSVRGQNDDPVARWRLRLSAAESHLLEARWDSAEAAVDGVLPEMIGSLRAEGDGPAFLALALVLKAAAEAGRGRDDDALWHWWMAQNLDPALRSSELPAFGKAAALLARHRLRQAGEVPAGEPVVDDVEERSSIRYRPPVATATLLPGVPREHWEGRVLVEVVVDRRGKVSQPVLLDDGGAPLSHVVRQLAAIQGWRFRPATLGRKRFAELVTFDALGVPGVDWYPWLPDLRRIEARFTVAVHERPTGGFSALLARALERMDDDPAEAACLYRSSTSRVSHEVRPVLRDLARLAEETATVVDDADRRPLLIGGDVRAPRALYTPDVAYTTFARRARIQGVSVVLVTVGTDGRVHSAMGMKGLPMGLDLVAIAAACSARYEPATYRGEPVAVYFSRTFEFSFE